MPSHCHNCTSPSLTQISITMADGSVVDFASCHRCEAKSYTSGGQQLPLDHVLSLASRRK